MPTRYPPNDPREWINRAQSNLAIAQTRGQDVYFEDLCFNAQQAAEKAIKAVMLQFEIDFPYIHDLAALLTILEQSGHDVPTRIRQAERLTRFAVFTRYPGISPPISEREYQQAIEVAELVVDWASGQIEVETQ